MTESSAQERRQFSRIAFDTAAHLKSVSNDLYLNTKVIDISLKGVLLTMPANWQGEIGSEFNLDLLLEQAKDVIKMTVSVAHIDSENDSIGFICTSIDQDSISHLKRLIELNLADNKLLQRELTALIADNSSSR